MPRRFHSAGSYSLNLNRVPRQLSDMEWDTLGHAADVELSTNCLTAAKNTSAGPSTVRGTCLYTGNGCHEFHVILDNLGPDGVWVGMAPPDMDALKCVGDHGCGWALHTDGDKRFGGREEEFTGAMPNAVYDSTMPCVQQGALHSTGCAYVSILFLRVFRVHVCPGTSCC